MIHTPSSARSRTFVSAALLLGALTACTGGGAQGNPPPSGVASITLSPATLSVLVGAAATLSATAKDAQGQTLTNVSFRWTSDRETVARVASGVVTGVSAGSASVTASVGGVTSAPATVNVSVPSPAGFDLSLSTDKLPVITGQSASLSVNVARTGTFSGAVTLTVEGLPSGATAAPVTVPEGQTTAVVTVSAGASAPHSFPTGVTLRGASGAQVVTKPLTVTVRGPAGSLDTTFGAAGSSVVDFAGRDDYATAMVAQPDGRVILAGYAPGASGEGLTFALTRLTRDGALDTGFGAGGRVQVNFGAGNDQAYAVAVQPDGKVLVAGFAEVAGNRDFAAARLNADGSLDAGFGIGGRVTAAIGAAEDRAYALALQPDGKVVLGGTSNSGGASGLDFALVRLTASGNMDSSFGSGGKVVSAVAQGSVSDAVYALALHGDSILAAGGESDFMLAKYSASGALDTTFGTGGKLAGLFGSSVGRARGLALTTVGGQPRLIVAGGAGNNTAAARLTLDGSLDSTFGTAGKTVIPVSAAQWDEASGVAVQPDGKVVLGGWANDATTTGNFAVLRLTGAGQPDAGFGTGGTVLTPLAPAGKNDLGRAVLLQPDDRIPATRILVAGERVPGFSDFAATRYWP